MKKVIYLCGPINNCSDNECKDWREYIKNKLSDKYDFLDPMRRDYRGIENSSVNEIVQGDYDDLKNSDIILALTGTPSWGTAMEIHHAKIILNKQVISVCNSERISPWLKYHSTTLVKTLDEAVNLLST